MQIQNKFVIKMSFALQPEQTPKRPNDEESTHGAGDDRLVGHLSKKLKKSMNYIADTEPELTEEEKLKILRYVDQEETTGDVLDETGLRKMILLFEKRNLKNQEMRIKFPENPEKFMESEIDLHIAIDSLKAVATVPDLYPVLVDLNAIPSLLELLSHQNTDISVAIVDLLQELTDVDILHESLDGAEVLIESLRKQQICALLVQNLERLDETVKEESDGVFNTLSIFENLTEIYPELCKEAAEQGLIQWILKRLKLKMPFDGNKLYCSEILSILIQNHSENRLLLGSLDGIDILLQQLAIYKRHDPTTSEEQEFMENLFNCMCSAMMTKENRDRFLKGEGLQLMNLMLREKKMSRNGSLKVLDHALSGLDGRENCNKFVDILGLRTIFPLFMKTPKKGKNRSLGADEHEEHVASIIATMLRNCKGGQRQRLLSKFTENDFEKVERLIELHLKYLDKVETVDAQIDAAGGVEQDADANYLKRLSAGLFTLQLIDYIILEVSASSEPVKQKILQFLNMRKTSMKTIRQIMREYAGNLGEDDESTEWRAHEQQHIIQLIDRF